MKFFVKGRHRRTSRMPRHALVGILALGLVALSGCSYADNTSGETSVVYRGGATGATDRSYKTCVPAAKSNKIGVNDTRYIYPANTRDFSFGTGEGSQERGAIEVVTKDNVTMQVNGIFNFALNITCDDKGGPLKTFHEQIGTHYGANSDDIPKDWNAMMAKYVGQPLERALDDATKSYNWLELYSGAKKPEWEKKVADLMTNYSKAQTGQEYWCEPNFRGSGNCGEPTLTVQQPVPPKNISDAMAAAQAAIENKKAALNNNATITTEAEGIAILVKILGPQGYVLYQAMKDGRITLMPIPQGGNINVQPK